MDENKNEFTILTSSSKQNINIISEEKSKEFLELFNKPKTEEQKAFMRQCKEIGTKLREDRKIKTIQENSITNKEDGSLQAFTEFKCLLCGKNDTWHNSNTPNICTKCAKKLIKDV